MSKSRAAGSSRSLRTVYDPEIPVNIYELGLIYKIDVEDDDRVMVEMTLTSPHCPVAETLPGEIEHKVASVDGVAGCEVKVVWDPPWNPVDDDRGSPARAGDDLLGSELVLVLYPRPAEALEHATQVRPAADRQPRRNQRHVEIGPRREQPHAMMRSALIPAAHRVAGGEIGLDPELGWSIRS